MSSITCRCHDEPRIEFGATEPWMEDEAPKPVPSHKYTPEWIKASPVYGQEGRGSAPTIKRCAPTRDAVFSGYLMRLHSDVTINRRSDGRLLMSSNPRRIISPVGQFPKEQLAHYPIPEGYLPTALKWVNPWTIKTPPGSSVMITHPRGRGIDDFVTLDAVVDTDTWKKTINFAFLIREDFSGLIPAGTPIAQVIPFFRQSWRHSLTTEDPEQLFVEDQIFKTSWELGYQQKYRSPKEYR